MAQLIVRNLESSVKERLRRRARLHRRSMEDEVREILRNSVNADEPARDGLGTEIAGLFRTAGLDTEIPEFRRQTLKPPRFEE